MKHLKWTARVLGILYTTLFFLFALFSGFGQLGGGLKGIILNLPNTLPWVILGIFVWIAWKEEFIGGSIIAFFGFITIFFFDTYRNPVAFMIISFPLLLIGALFIINYHSNNKKKVKKKIKKSLKK